jgi:hypothetical protein
LKNFRRYFHDKIADVSFREFYEKECHVCSNTLRIFEKMDRDHLSIEEVASDLQTDPQCLKKLLDADYRDPELVIRLCRKLELPLPRNCPREENTSS